MFSSLLTCVNADGLLQVVRDVPQKLIEEEENHQRDSHLDLQCGVLQVLQDQLQQDGGSDELEDHGEDDQENGDDQLDSGEPPDGFGERGRLRPPTLLLPEPLEPRGVPLSVVLLAELQDVGGGQTVLGIMSV